MPPPSRKAGSSNTRSKSGCLTCRSRKVKCDEAKPGCQMCTRLRLRCEYGAEEKTTRLHDRRLGAGPLKKRQFTNWRPQKIVPKTPIAAAASLSIAPAAVASPGPSVTSMPSTISSLSSPSVSTTPPYLGTTTATSSNMATYTPASEYAEYQTDGSGLSQNPSNDIASGGPINTTSSVPHVTPTITDTNLDFSTFVNDDLLNSTSMSTPSPFSFMQSMDEADFMFFGDLSTTPLSPLLPSSSMTMATPSCAAPTPITPDENNSEVANCNVVTHKNSSNSTFHLVSTTGPSPLNGLILGTTTIVLASFPSRMRLTERDFEALLLFHQQVGFSIGSKSPVWSTHAILIKLAVHHAPILHLLLAASFGELDWRLTAESGNNGITGSATGTPAILPARPSTKGGALTPGQLARRHYDAGQAALKELVVAPRGTPEAGLFHVVVVACFWLEYLIHRRNTLQHGRWGSNNEFSKAMGDYMRKYQLRRGLMSGEALPPASFSAKRPPSPPKCVPVQEDEDQDPNSDEDDETDEFEFIENKNDVNSRNSNQMTNDPVLATPTAAALATTAPPTNMAKPIKDLSPADRPLPPVKYRSFMSRLLSWLYWYDCAACFFGKGGALSVQFRMPPRNQLGFYETARTTLLDFWDDYTPEEIADDNQNWPALQLINETWVAVHRLNLVYEAEEMQDKADAQGHKQGRRSSSSPTSSESVAQIARDARSLRSRYTTVFRLSAFAATSGGHRSRLLAMADWAVCHYLSLELHLLRAGATREDLYGEEGPAKELALLGIAAPDDGGINTNSYDYNYNYGNYQQQSSSFNSYQSYSPLGAPASHRQAIAAKIVHLAERAIRTVGPVELDRFQWPLFWAGVETDNHVYRYFVLSNLINADFRVALQTVVREQSTMSGVGDGGGGGNGSEIGYYGTTGSTGVSMRRLRTICRAAGMAA
ncbi:hypothetical protein Sste5346_007251 [Sporothrix stenoceras]|uniref:Zn(2)-C6 fungal-type domain-containing protein n=1 Tax=Sporothrix stenoceras TaxID=5173 RepID=A0ABR3YUU6_9PEZI